MDKSVIKINATPYFFAGVFLLSLAMLAFEIVASRVTSVIYTHNYVFIIVSLAILGLGAGGIFAFYGWRHKELDEPSKNLSLQTSLFSISVSLYIIFATSSNLYATKGLYFITLFIPFFFAGVALSLAFRVFAIESFKLYAFDLAGAAFGSILSIWILNTMGGIDGILFIGVLGAAASSFLAGGRKLFSLKIQAALSIVCIALFFADLSFLVLIEICLIASRSSLGSLTVKTLSIVLILIPP